ncbi:MAG: hypothetical protein EZS28_030483 [Streblomastix strix]|uniref:Uncharacterized protein n=1 Tax=Streblomastix strix TaxID=222440 RepID=A0A5J4UUW6_9EUKA|nr:MAG: hypothetical protein EZS28_030483 [Streblomastix strix]
MTELDLNQIEKEARQEFEAEKSQGAGDACGLMEVDGMEDDYYESQPARQDRMKSRAKPFGRLPFHPNMIQRKIKHAGPQFREEAGDVLATLVGYLNRDIKKINRLSSAVSAQKYIDDKHLGKRISVQEQDLDDNVATPDNVVVFDKKKNAIYSVDGYTTAVGFGDPEHQHKRNWKKQYYTNVNDLERAVLASKLKQQGIKGGPYMKWLSMTKPHKVREIKDYSFRTFTIMAKNIQTLMEAQNCQWQPNNKQWHLLGIQLYKKELPAVIAQLYQAEDVDARIKEALEQAMQYYGQMLTWRLQQIGGFDLAKYKFQ